MPFILTSVTSSSVTKYKSFALYTNVASAADAALVGHHPVSMNA